VSLQRNDTKYGAIDILLTPEKKDSDSIDALGVIEVGRNGSQWWRKLDQNLKYLANMGSHQCDKRLNTEPSLMVVLTIEGEDGGADVKFEVRLESLMPQRAARIDDYRMSLVAFTHQ
jgi:hypothetical protein